MNYQSNTNVSNFDVYDARSVAKTAFLQKVYLLLFCSVAVGGFGAYLGANSRQLLEIVIRNQIAFLLIYIFGCFLVHAVKSIPGLNLVALFAFTFVTGLYISPLIFLVAATKGVNLIYEALTITGVTFVGLTMYVLLTKKDFSFMHGMLTAVTFAMFAAAIAFIFFPVSSAVYTGFCVIGVLLFSGYILYDTSVLMRNWESNDYIGFTLALYMDVLGLFLYLLRLLGGNRD